MRTALLLSLLLPLPSAFAGCFDEAIAGKDVDASTRTLLAGPANYDVIEGIRCLAARGRKSDAAAIAALAKSADETVRIEVAATLTHFASAPVVVETITKLLEGEKEYTLAMNVMSRMEAPTDAKLREALVGPLSGFAQRAWAKGDTYLNDAYFNALGPLAPTHDGVFRRLGEAPKLKAVASATKAMAVPPGGRGAERTRRLLESWLAENNRDTTLTSRISEALVSFGDERSLDAFGKALRGCDEGACKVLLWSIASYAGAKADAVLKAATKHPEKEAADVARRAIAYRANPKREAYVLKIIATPVSDKRKGVDWSAYRFRNELALLAARDRNGLGRQAIETIVEKYQRTQSLDWQEMMLAYLRRFGSDTTRVIAFYERIPPYTLAKTPIELFLVRHPSPAACPALVRGAEKGEDRLRNSLIYLRQRGACA